MKSPTANPGITEFRGETEGFRKRAALRFRSIFFLLVSATALSSLSFAMGQLWESLGARAQHQTETLNQSVAWVRSSLLSEKPELTLLPSTASPEIFRVLKTFEARALTTGNTGVRAGVIDDSGTFLAHSIPHLVGTTVSTGSKLRQELIQPTFERKLNAFSRKTQGVDGLEVYAFVERLGNSRFAFLVEIPSQGLILQELEVLVRSIASWIFWCIAMVSVISVFAAAVRVTQRTITRWLREPVQAPVLEANLPAPPRRVPPPPPRESDSSFVPTAFGGAAEPLLTDSLAGPVSWVLPERLGGAQAPNFSTLTSSRPDEETLESDLLDHFEWEAAHLRDARQVARRLVETASSLCQSPALFFRFDSGLHAAFLEAESGLSSGTSESRLSFPIDSKSLGRILDQSLKGGMESLAQFHPLSTLILAQLGVSHFDAWAITGFSHLGRASRSPRLLGVLVILRAGVESHARRKSLGRMMRATGLIYENTVLSQ